MTRVLALVLCVLAGQAPAQDTLADMKQDLAVLTVELQKLKRELSTTGASGVAVGGSQLDRINAIEGQLAYITSKTEQLEFRIGQVAQDGANRLGDLEFRICELEDGCDIGALGASLPLGGEIAPDAAQPVAPATDSLPYDGELAVSEEADFRSAEKALADGDGEHAALLFAQFRETYPMGPLEAAALVGEGKALALTGDTREAARRYLNAYSGFPESQIAPEALWRLGVSLGELGSVPEACVTLSEVAGRYPQSGFVAQAQDSRAALGCQ
ncbi:tetratricopeptide repeat protein [Tropicibacter naphthalenivorans]|uniref:Cell division coordinator CpoB n=1 Tax=Tropicibacter naphthalenivorans TaxID=441103 RepID=A0A0P1G9F8_9RHOB|nr:tetratricopeptide repeat protein [Tropicibacter naphthalenivorans]CUH78191.1 tol-pal system protein YbgF [Tropicibacter naphthalenivorans]SMC78247.1 tol-pal system protein YbgF [Tropicibacter naphthalenivorans]